MLELVDMLGRSILGIIPRLCVSLWTCHLKRDGGCFRVPFCDPTEGILKFLFGDIFYMRGDPLKEKTILLLLSTGLHIPFPDPNVSVDRLKMIIFAENLPFFAAHERFLCNVFFSLSSLCT